MRIGTAITADYADVARPLLESLHLLPDRPFCVTVNCDLPALARDYPWVEFGRVDNPPDIDPQYVCLQHGPFLDGLKNLSDFEVVMLLDADGWVQRDLAQHERMALTWGEWCWGPNNGPDDTIADEWARLYPVQKPAWMPIWGPNRCYNGGLICSSNIPWRAVQEAYHKVWPDHDKVVSKHRTQVLLNVAVKRAGVGVICVGREIHNHNHFDDGATQAEPGGQYLWDGHPPFFIHRSRVKSPSLLRPFKP